MINNCTGNGRCLMVDWGNDMYHYYPKYKCIYNCKPVKCVNYIFCGESFTDKNINKCNNCTKIWKGKDPLLTDSNTTCQICKQVDNCVKLPECIHCICIECFQNKHTNCNGTKWNEEDDDFYYDKGIYGICFICDYNSNIKTILDPYLCDDLIYLIINLTWN